MTGTERGLTPGDDDEEEILQSTWAAALSSGDEARIAEVRAMLADPLRVQRRAFERRYARHVRHLEARRRATPDD